MSPVTSSAESSPSNAGRAAGAAGKGSELDLTTDFPPLQQQATSIDQSTDSTSSVTSSTWHSAQSTEGGVTSVAWPSMRSSPTTSDPPAPPSSTSSSSSSRPAVISNNKEASENPPPPPQPFEKNHST